MMESTSSNNNTVVILAIAVAAIILAVLAITPAAISAPVTILRNYQGTVVASPPLSKSQGALVSSQH